MSFHATYLVVFTMKWQNTSNPEKCVMNMECPLHMHAFMECLQMLPSLLALWLFWGFVICKPGSVLWASEHREERDLPSAILCGLSINRIDDQNISASLPVSSRGCPLLFRSPSGLQYRGKLVGPWVQRYPLYPVWRSSCCSSGRQPISPQQPLYRHCPCSSEHSVWSASLWYSQIPLHPDQTCDLEAVASCPTCTIFNMIWRNLSFPSQPSASG